MSTVKITELPIISDLDTNTANTLFVGVDRTTDVTGHFTATTLAEGLYSHNPLNVGNNHILFSHTIAQFSGNSSTYLQTNFQNFTSTGSVDVVLTSDIGTDTGNYIDLGINNSAFSDPAYSAMKPTDGYLYVAGSSGSSSTGNLVIGTASYGANVVFVAGGTTSSNVVATFNEDEITINNPTIINQFGTSPDFGNDNALIINNYGNGYSLLVNDIDFDTTPFTIDNNGNTAIGSLTTNGYKFYVSGNTYFSGNVVTSGVLTLKDGSSISSNAWISANDTATLSTSKSYTDTANSWLQANDTVTLSSAKSYTDTANTFLRANDTVTLSSAKSYTDSANSWIRTNYLANTPNSLFNGTLNISDKLNVNGSVIFANTNFTDTQAAMTIAACPIGDIQLPSNDGYMLHISGKQNVSSRIVFDSFGANTYAVLAGRTARGTPTSPQAVANGDILMRVSGNGYGTTKYATIGSGRIDIVATETHTDTSRATQIQFFTTVTGTNTQTQIASFNGSSALFTGVVNPQKGFIYTPTVYPTAQTAITVDFANNSVVRATTTSGLTVSFTNYTVGKVVDMWITNTAGTTQTFTHGCSATNSTVNSTTYGIPGTSTIYVKYMCFDGDLANTFVAITHT